jgi:phthalate 4,5-dioxygenase
MGEIADRTQEHLGRSDKAIAAYRRLLRMAIDAVDKGDQPPMIFDARLAAKITGPAAIDGIGPTDDWQDYWQKTDANKRNCATWANRR